MGTIAKYFLPILLLVSCCCFANTPDIKDPNEAWTEMLTAIANLQKNYFLKTSFIYDKIKSINQKIAVEKSVEIKLNLLVEKDILKDSLATLKRSEERRVGKECA